MTRHHIDLYVYCSKVATLLGSSAQSFVLVIMIMLFNLGSHHVDLYLDYSSRLGIHS